MIQETLKMLGFTNTEVEIYLEVLKLGRATPVRIAKNTGINRTTIYSSYKNLVKKGMMVEDIGNKYTYLIALPPKNLYSQIEKQEKQLEEEKKLINQAVSELKDLPINTQFAIPKIRFIEELDLDDYLYKRTDEWNKNIKQHDKTWWGFQDHTFIDHYKKWTIDYWDKFKSSEGILEKIISNQSETEKQMAEKLIGQREILFGKKISITSSFWVGGDYIIMIYTQNKPFYLIEIYNPVMAYNLREIFKTLWQELKNQKL